MFRKLLGIGFALVLGGAFAVPSAFAMQDMLNFKTNGPIEIPGRVIPAGKYSVMDATPDSSMPVVEIVNQKGHSYGFYQMEDVQRLNAPGRVIVKLKPEENSVARLKEFFTPDSNIGYEFEYPQRKPLA
jgi:hypothetical protein